MIWLQTLGWLLGAAVLIVIALAAIYVVTFVASEAWVRGRLVGANRYYCERLKKSGAGWPSTEETDDEVSKS